MTLPACRTEPLPGRQFAILLNDQERTRWRFDNETPRPCFFPIVGPSGTCLTRMGHPGAPNHDHHRSVWWAHTHVAGVDFWSEQKPSRIRQREWLAIEDGDDEARFAASLEWLDGHDPAPLLTQEMIVCARPMEGGEWTLELQSTWRAAGVTELAKTNFGFLAVRVAKHLSEHFGGGALTGDSGAQGEPALFGKPSRWMDYSGPVPRQAQADFDQEGIALFDHPQNPGSPARWHVRSDGWMGPSFNRDGPVSVGPDSPLTLRYLLWMHRGDGAPDRLAPKHADFAAAPPLAVIASSKPHVYCEIVRGSI